MAEETKDDLSGVLEREASCDVSIYRDEDGSFWVQDSDGNELAELDESTAALWSTAHRLREVLDELAQHVAELVTVPEEMAAKISAVLRDSEKWPAEVEDESNVLAEEPGLFLKIKYVAGQYVVYYNGVPSRIITAAEIGDYFPNN